MADTNTPEEATKTAPLRPRAYGLDDACRELGGVSRNTIYRLAAAGKLRIIKVGGRSVISDEDIVRLLDSEAV